MDNTIKILEMLNKIENSMNELTRRFTILESKLNTTQPIYVNPEPIFKPFVTPNSMFKPNEMHVLHGDNPRSPQCNPQYNPQYRLQYIVNKSIDELKSIRGRLLNHFTNCLKQGLSVNDDGIFDKLDAIERILIEGLINLQHNYNIHHKDDSDLIRISKAVSNIYTKHCFNTTPGITSNLNDLKHDIKELVRYWNINTVNNSNVNISQTIQPVGKENLLDMEEWVNKTGYKFQDSAIRINNNSNYGMFNIPKYKTTNTEVGVNASSYYYPQPFGVNSGIPISVNTIDTIIDALTNRHNVNLTPAELYALDRIKSLSPIPEDICNYVNSLHLHTTQYNCLREIFIPLLKDLTKIMFDRGYMDGYVNEKETVLEIIEQANIKLNILKTHINETVTPNRDILNTMMNNIESYIELNLDSLRKNNNKILEDKYFICKNISLEIINEIDGYLVGVNKTDIRYGVDYYTILKNIENIFNKHNLRFSYRERPSSGEDNVNWQTCLYGTDKPTSIKVSNVKKPTMDKSKQTNKPNRQQSYKQPYKR